MDNIITFPLKFFSWIISTSIMSLVLIVLILTIKSLFKYRLGAKWHYAIWFILIIRMLIPWAPESSFSIFNLFSFDKHTTVIQKVKYPINNTHDEIKVPIAKRSLSAKPSNNTSTTSVTIKSVENHSLWDYIKKITINLKTLYWIWVGGILIVGTYTFINSRKFQHGLKGQPFMSNSEIQKIFQTCKYKMYLNVDIPLIETDYIKSPTLVGLLKPRLLLPVNVLDTVTHEELSYIFLHELVHYKRKDIAINLLISVILIFHWFNPIIWYAFNKMRDDQEIACDALALSYVNIDELKNYALTLIKLLENFSKGPKIINAASVGGTKPQIKRRIRMIKSYKKHSFKWSLIGFVFIVVLSTTSLTNPRVGVLNNKALASEPAVNGQIKDAAADWIDNYSYRPENQDEKTVAYIITKYMHDTGNIDYRTMNGREGFEYLIPARQAQENVWVENTVSRFKQDKLIYSVNNIDIDFIYIRNEEATACLSGKITRTGESGEIPDIYENNFKAVFTLKKIDGKWLIITTPQNDNLASMKLLPSYEETAVRNVINKYVNNNYTHIRNIVIYIFPVTTSQEQVSAKYMLSINRLGKFDDSNITYSEQEFILQKIDNNWTIINSPVQKN